jgi:transcriptional regulator with XRE-family HTH domain
MAKARNTGKRAVTALTIEMAKPRFVASARDDVNVVSSFKGMYARVARKLNVSPSMVSRVANGLRSSPKIKKALLAEVDAIKQKLDAAT